jgi:hypothetical protein
VAGPDGGVRGPVRRLLVKSLVPLRVGLVLGHATNIAHRLSDKPVIALELFCEW